MEFWSSVAGMEEVELVSADPTLSIQAVNEAGISVRQVKFMDSLTVRFLIGRSDHDGLIKIAENRGESLRFCKKMGLYWFVIGMLRRWIFIGGIAAFMILALYLPTRVLFVQVDGNDAIPDNRILSGAESCGIRFWASRREVRSEKVKNALLSEVPELKWAGVNTYGCVAVISVRERCADQDRDIKDGVSSIIASRDGIIDFCTASKGNLLCVEGQVVKKGQVLISGYTDCGLYIQATSAEGEVFAQTRHDLTAIALSKCTVKGKIIDQKRKYSLLIGKKRINLWKGSGIWDTSCGRMYEEYYITLPGGLQLPLAFVVETYTFRETSLCEIPLSEKRTTLESFAGKYLTQQMVAGRILSETTEILPEDGRFRLEGSYLCREMIGRVQREKIGE